MKGKTTSINIGVEVFLKAGEEFADFFGFAQVGHCVSDGVIL
jgi:hypothetical protein